MSMTFRAIVRREGANRAAQAAKQEAKPKKAKKKEAPVVEVVEDGEQEAAPVQAEEEAK